MELDLTVDQELLRETAAKYIEATCPLVTVRQLVDSETGLPPTYLRDAAELGWFAPLVAEEHGGGSISGQPVQELAIVAEERGRGLQPGPFIPMNVVASAISRCGTPAQQAEVLPALASGAATATWVSDGFAGPSAPGPGITATPSDGTIVLSGQSGLVQDGGLADWFLVTAGGPGGISQFLMPSSTPGVTASLRQGHDITQRFATVAFDGVRLSGDALVGAAGAAADDVEHQLQLALVLSVAESIGALDVLFEMTREYAVDRVAFGRPIGSFQAVKHQLADLSLSLEAGKAISTAATRAVQEGQEDAGEVASMAKAWVGDTSIDIAQGCFQVFGGIGYTWEHDSHLFLRRVTMNSLLFGQADWHRERICVIHGL